MKAMPFRRIQPGLFCLFVSALFALQPFVFADGNINTTNKYAWAENGGWLNFRPSNGGVTVHCDGSNRFLSGYAWGENVGWVKLGASTNGPFNNDATNDWGVNMDANWALSGYGWNENAGWINFDSTPTNVTIDSATGSFDGYAWSENGGWIHFKNEASSNAYNVQTLALSAPANVSATDGSYSNKVLITWASVQRATSYEVWRNTSSNSDTASKLSAPGITNYDDISAVPGTNYYYWVKAAGASWTSEFSSCDSGWRGLLPPSGLLASDGTYEDKVAVTWHANTNAWGYEVYRSLSSDAGTAAYLDRTGAMTLTNYDDTTALPGMDYYYWIKATNNICASGLSSSDSGYRVLLAPADVLASDGTYEDKVRVQWSAVSGADSYCVFHSASISGTKTPIVSWQSGTTCDDISTPIGQVYYYWVKAKTSQHESEYSSYNTGWRKGSKPESPAGVSASDGTYMDKVRVQWSAVSGAGSYRIFRATSPGGTKTALGSWQAETAYNDTSAAERQTYYYWVKAKNNYNESEYSAYDSGWRNSPTPRAPTGLSASDGKFSDKVLLTWSAVSGATRYEIWRWKSSGSAGKLDDTTAASYADISADIGVMYYYSVKAKNSSGTSDFSNSDSGWRQYGVPAAPTGVSASDGLCSLCVTWITVSGSASYEVWRNTVDDSSSAIWLADVVSLLATYDDTSATLEKTYYYWVKAKNDSGTSDFSNSDSGWWRRGISGDYDGDMTSDLAIYKPITATWYIWSLTRGIIVFGETWGISDGSSVALPGDYDGDGITDMAVYDETMGWYIRTVAGSVIANGMMFGGTGYYPVSGDFDGDEKTDIAVYHESTGYWFVFLSGSQALAYLKFGAVGYDPVRGDFDGDGKTDLAVYQESSGYWYVLLSGSEYSLSYLKFGASGYTPVPGDYDGDGKTDVAVYHEATGYWYILLSGSSYSMSYQKFGESGYTPVPADYDGDRITDLAVYHEASGYWYMILSSSGALSYQKLGEPGYVPIW